MLTIYNTRDAIAQARPQIAVAPFATVHNHGPHLPLETDILILDAVARGLGAALTEETYVLPAFPFGTSQEMADFAGSIWIRSETLFRVVKDVTWSLRHQGIRKIVILAGVGIVAGTPVVPWENYVVKPAVRECNHDWPDIDVIWCQPATLAQVALREICSSGNDDVNGGELEASLVLHLAPERVGALPSDVIPAASRDMLQQVPFARLSPSGVWGKPSLASKEKGARAFEAMVQATAAYAEQQFSYLAGIKDRSRTPIPMPAT